MEQEIMMRVLICGECNECICFLLLIRIHMLISLFSASYYIRLTVYGKIGVSLVLLNCDSYRLNLSQNLNN